jgi:peptidoglycan/LPS O-acetylase OafA/YrhL
LGRSDLAINRDAIVAEWKNNPKMKVILHRLDVLDAGRGIAALLIVFHHAYGHLMERYPYHSGVASGWSDKIRAVIYLLFWVPDQFNHIAVLFFFVLSGFCIHYREARLLSAGELNTIRPLQFYFRRFVRIVPPLFVALLITYSCDVWSERLLHNVKAHIPSTHQMTSAVGGTYKSTSLFFGNLCLLMPFFVNPYGTNWPLWALGYEVWYYLLYPAWLWISRAHGGTAAFVTSIGVAALSVIFIHGHGFPLYPVLSTWWLWCLGAILAEIHTGRYTFRWLTTIPVWLLGLAILLLLFVLSLFPPQHSLTAYVSWSPILGIIVYRCTSHTISRVTGYLSFVGRFSYSLYIIHMPILVLLSALWLRYYGPLPHFPWLVFAGIVCTGFAGWGVAMLVERPLEQLRARVGL